MMNAAADDMVKHTYGTNIIPTCAYEYDYNMSYNMKCVTTALVISGDSVHDVALCVQ